MTTEQKLERKVEMSRKYWDQYSEVAWSKKVTQETAQYNPLGGTDTEACVNCQFFMSPDYCSVVESFPLPIAATGRSRFWTALEQYEQEPIKVIIVEEEEEAGEREKKDTLWDSFKALAATIFAPPVAPVMLEPVKEWTEEEEAVEQKEQAALSGFKVFQDNTGDLRWLAWVSNNFKDREGEIFEDSAHREFVEYLDNGGTMPEAWLWHTPGTRWGQADFADYADGFLVMSGTVDDTYEARAVAKGLAEEESTLGVSHGFYFRYSNEDKGFIGWYRSFEISPLPLVAAANTWTGIQVIREAKEMNAAKRAWLDSKLGADRVNQLIADRADFSKTLNELGIDSKGMPSDDAPVMPSVADIAGAAAKAITDSAEWASLFGTVSAVKSSADATSAKLTELETRIKQLEQTDDEKVAAALLGQRSRQTGYRASEAPDSRVGDDAGDAFLRSAGPIKLVDEGFAKSLFN